MHWGCLRGVADTMLAQMTAAPAAIRCLLLLQLHDLARSAFPYAAIACHSVFFTITNALCCAAPCCSAGNFVKKGPSA